jgi:hypothetical protein
MATIEEAQRCPRCDKPGELGAARPHPEKAGHQVLMATCRNPLCPWLDTGWTIMLLPDGSVPEAAPAGTARGSRIWTEDQARTKAEQNRLVEEVNNALAQYAQPGDLGEIRRR